MKKFFSTKLFKYVIVPFIGGALYASGFPLANEAVFLPGTAIGLILLFLSLSYFSGEKKWKRDFGVIFSFSIGYTFLGYYWIPYTLKVFGAIPIPFNIMISIPFGIIITPHYYLFAIATLFLPQFKRLFLRSFILAIIITLLEYFTPQQFPSHAGHPWLTINPYLGLAPILGSILYSFITFLLAISIVNFIKTKKIEILSPIIFILVLMIGIFLPIEKTLDSTPLNVRLVQANIGNNTKISSIAGNMGAREYVYNSYFELSTAASKKAIDLIVWPETAYPYLLSSQQIKASNYLPELFQQIIEKSKASLFLGGYDMVPESEGYFFEDQYNTTFLFNQDLSLQNFYHKRRLIPFGETLPLGIFKKSASKLIKNISYFASGKKFTLFNIKDKHFTAAICYEILFSSYIRQYLNSVNPQPNFIINVTNDSWYGKTSEPYQHLFLAKWRALEFNIPIVRITNTGISSIIYPDGSESSRIPLFVKKSIDVQLRAPNRKPTFYQKYGILPLFILWIIFLIPWIDRKAFLKKIMKSDKSQKSL